MKEAVSYRFVLPVLCMILAAMAAFTEWQVYGSVSIKNHVEQAGVVVPPRASTVFPVPERILAWWSRFLQGRGVSRAWGLVSLRFIQNSLILFLAALWWKRLKLSPSRGFVGLLMLTWGLLYAFREGRIDTGVFWVAVWSLAGVIILDGRRRAFFPLLTFFGASLSVFAVILPILPLACVGEILGESRRRSRGWLVFLFSLLAWIAGIGVFGNLSGRPWPSLVWGHRPGFDLLLYNFGHSLTWVRLIWLCSILPVLALLVFPSWPARLQRLAPISLVPMLVALFITFFPDHRLVIIPLAVFVIPGFLFFPGPGGTVAGFFRWAVRRSEALLIVLLAVGALYSQLWVLGGVKGRYLRETQLTRHQEVMDGTATSPWRYRIFSQGLVEVFLRLGNSMGLGEAGVSFSTFRLLQNLLIFFLAAALYRNWKFSAAPRAIGLVLAGWGMTHAFYNSDLSFSTYTDLILYLLGAIAVTKGKPGWFIPLTVIAALNRETGVLLPSLLIPGACRKEGAKERALFLASLGIFLALFFAIRYLWLPGASFIETWGAPGWKRLVKNLSNALAWRNVFLVANLLPLAGFFFIRRWPKRLGEMFLPLIPAWIFLHYYAKAYPEETRFLLVPLFLGFVPAVLCCLDGEREWKINGPVKPDRGQGEYPPGGKRIDQ